MLPYKNILVHCLVNLGDVLVSTSAVALLKKIQPDAKITMMVRPAVREVVENNPVIDEVLVFDYKAKQRSFKSMLAMVKTLKEKNFALCVSFDRKSRPAILTRLAGIPTRVGPNRIFNDVPSKVPWLYTHTIKLPDDFETTLQAENYQTIVRGFFQTDLHANPVMSMPLSENILRAHELLDSLPKARIKIALCIKGTFPLKTWPKEYFIRLVKKLKENYDAAFFVIGAPEDFAYAEEFIQASDVTVANFCGKTKIKDMVPLFKQTDLFITVDTGAAHIAATTGVPMVVMYGCTTPKRWAPINQQASVLSSAEKCCPCHIAVENCPSNPKPNCLWGITPDEVLSESCLLLKSKFSI